MAYNDVQGGYLDNVALGLSDVDRTTRTGGRAAVRVQLSPTWQADLSSRLPAPALARHPIHHPRPVRPRAAWPALPRLQRPAGKRVREAHNNNFSEAALNLQGDLGWADLASTTAYVDHDFASQYDATAAAGRDLRASCGRSRRLFRACAHPPAGPGPGVHIQERWSVFDWLVGAYFSDSIERTPSFLVVQQPNMGSSAVYRENRRDKIRDLAVYGEGSWRSAPGWNRLGGGADLRDRSEGRF